MDDLPDNLLSTIIAMIILVALSAFFSASETAFSSLNRTKMKNFAREGKTGATRALRLAEQYDKLLSTILIGNNIVNITFTSLATVLFVNLLGGGKGPTVATIVSTVLVLIFGEITPKSLAKDSPERVSMAVAPTLRLLMWIISPLNWLFTQWKKLLSRIFRPSGDGGVTEGELLTLVDEAREDGGIDEEDKRLIQNIFEFDDITAGEISTHRTDIALLWLSDTDEEWEQTIRSSRHAIYPVCDETVDDVVGVLNAKDYFWLEDKSRDNVMVKAVRPAYFVPESVKADVLFRNMKRSRQRCAIVVDEYGGVNGIVTMSDLVEQLVGEFDDNDGIETPQNIVELSPNHWKILGAAPLDEVAEALEIHLPCDDYDTFGGMILGSISAIPADGSVFSLVSHGLNIKVTELADRRVVSCEVSKETPAADDEKSVHEDGN